MNFHKTILKNGLRLITVPMQDNPTVTVMVLVEAGSKYETKKISGVSHFLEHMCFKGTTKRPKAIDIVKELDGIGASYNAFTAQEMTGYYAKSDRRHFANILDVVSDIYLNSIFPEAELEKEKGVIVEEIRMYQDLPPRHINEILMELLYGTQPAGWDIAGTEKTVRSMTRVKMSAYRRQHYVSKATTVVVAGNVDENEMNEQVERAFKKMSDGKKQPKVAVKEAQRKPEIAISYKETDQVHLALALRTFNLFERDLPAMQVLATLLGGNMSSRLFQKMRDELGICYYIRVAQESFTDHGFLEITAGVPAKRLSEAVSALLAELRLLKSQPIGNEELSHVKEYITGNMYLGLESSDSLAEFYGFQEIVKKPILLPQEAANQIRAVTKEEVNRLVGKYFVNEGLNLALIGPLKSKKELEKLLHL